jgi:hypothetical protein
MDNVIRIREAVAVFLYGHGYTSENYKSIAIYMDGRWYRYPDHGYWRVDGKKIHITKRDQNGNV